MNCTRILACMAAGALLFVPLVFAQNLSSYRQFQLETDLATVAKQTGMKPSEAKTIHTRPALIQELEWHHNRTIAVRTDKSDSVTELLFSFYNGDLFR